MSQVTPRTTKVLLQDTTEVVSCRKLWPWIPGVHAKTVSAGTEEAAVMTAAELLYADMCIPRGSSAASVTSLKANTHVPQWRQFVDALRTDQHDLYRAL